MDMGPQSLVNQSPADALTKSRPHTLFTGGKHMGQILLAVSALLLATGTAYAQAETPGIDQRQANQEQRIEQGIASGQLNQRETNRLEREQTRINRMEDRAKADGVVTKRERSKINHAQNRASRDIYRQKHDAQTNRHR